MEKEKITHIVVSKETRRDLMLMKSQYGFSSVNKLIEAMIRIVKITGINQNGY